MYELSLVLGIVNILAGLYCFVQGARLFFQNLDDGSEKKYTIISILGMVIGITVFFYGAWMLSSI